nr:hypothetical protein [Tanacetum cinerariifolium]
NDQDDAEMFDVNDLHREEVFVEKEVTDIEVSAAELETNIASIEKWDDIHAKIDVDYQLAQRLQTEEQEELTIEEKATLFKEFLEKRRKHFAVKATEKKEEQTTNTSLTNKNHVYLSQECGRKEARGFKEQLVEGSSKRAKEELTQERAKKQKVDDNKETSELKEVMKIIPDEEEVENDAISLAVKSLKIVDWKIHKEGKKSYYQIIRADGKSTMYMFFNRMLKEF